MKNRELAKIKKFITEEREIFFKIACNYISNESIILDVGSGDGHFAKCINRSDVYMVDGNIESVNNLKKQYKNVFHSTLPELPFTDKQFNVIHCSHVIERLSPENLYLTLKEFDRCLNDNGYLIISAPLLWNEFYDDLSHLKPYNPKVFEKYFTWNNPSCCTRSLISSNYTVKEKIFRYSLVELHSDVVNTSSPFLNSIFHYYYKAVKKLGFRSLEKSGFTLVLQKGN